MGRADRGHGIGRRRLHLIISWEEKDNPEDEAEVNAAEMQAEKAKGRD